MSAALSRPGKWFAWLLTLVLDLVAVLTILAGPESFSNATLVAVIVLGTISLVLLGDNIYLRYSWARRSRYAHAFRYLNKGFQEIHDLSRQDNATQREIRSSLEKLCTSLAEAFGFVSSTRCSACIKVLQVVEVDGQSTVAYQTFCRDLNVHDQRQRVDKITVEKGIHHTIENNSAFVQSHNSIHSAGERGFFSNRLPLDVNYQNTSFHDDLYGPPYAGLNPLYRIWRWPLPYTSTIVVPIYPLHPNATLETGDSEVTSKIPKGTEGALVGFLCIDSDDFRAFRIKFDREIMNGVADGMYNALRKYKNVVTGS